MGSIIRSYTDGFSVIDQTQNLMIVPNQWGLINSLGIFENEPVAENTIQLEKITKDQATIVDKVRGERNTQSKDYVREVRAFVIPHFPFDDYITPKDIQGKRAYGSEGVETLDAVRARKLERIRKSHAQTLEVARAQLITVGTAYAPTGTVSANYYTEFGITRTVIDFLFGATTSDVRGFIEQGIADIQDKAFSGDIAGGFVALCSPVFFTKLINHATTVTAYQYYTSTQEPLRQRLDATGLDGRFREFYHAGVRFIEYRGSFGGTALIPSGDAYLFPTNIGDSFKTFFAPAEKFDLVNTLGEEAYAFEYADPKGEKIEIQSESNFLNVLRRPAVVVRLTSST